MPSADGSKAPLAERLLLLANVSHALASAGIDLQSLLERVARGGDRAAREQNARHDAELAIGRVIRLQELTAALSEVLTPADVAEAVVSHGVAGVGAASGVVAMLAADERSLRLLAQRGLAADAGALSLDADGPLDAVIRSGEPLFIASHEMFRQRFGDTVDSSRSMLGTGALCALPLKREGRVVGALGFGFGDGESRMFERDLRAFVATLAGQCGTALERARLHQALETEKQRWSFLAGAGARLAGSLGCEATAEALARLVVPHLAPFAMVLHREDDGALRLLAAAHADPKAEAAIMRTFAHAVFACDHPVALAARTRRTELGGSSGDPLPLAASVAMPLMARGQTLGVLFIGLEDVTTAIDVPLVEEVARRGALALDSARLFGHAQEVGRVKDEFLSIVSHELRTPLNAILGWSRMLRSGRVKPEGTERALRTIERNATLQAQLVEDLVDASRIMAQKLRLDMRAIDLARAVEAAVESVTLAAGVKGVALELAIAAIPSVRGDPDRLQQLVMNLLTNAIKFSREGKIVYVTVDRDASDAVIRVRDEGEGIAPRFLPHVFDRFRQADSTTTRRHGGLGLGLAIVRHLVEAHGGTVVAESAGEGTGATFTVRLPIVADLGEGDAAGDPSREPQVHHAHGLGGLSVLLVDDESDAREILAEALGLEGARIFIASDAAAALAIVRAEHPDVIVSELGLPGDDGYAFIRSVRAEGVLIPAIALTAYAREADRVEALAAGYQIHLSKPVDPAQLALAVGALAAR